MRKSIGGYDLALCPRCGEWHVWCDDWSLEELAEYCAKVSPDEQPELFK